MKREDMARNAEGQYKTAYTRYDRKDPFVMTHSGNTSSAYMCTAHDNVTPNQPHGSSDSHRLASKDVPNEPHSNWCLRLIAFLLAE